MSYTLESAIGHTIMVLCFSLFFIAMSVGAFGLREGLKTLFIFQKEDREIPTVFYGYIVCMLSLIWGIYAIV